MNDQIQHYEEKLSYETDSWDLNEAIQNGENIIVIDARSAEAFAEEHIPGAVSLPASDNELRDYIASGPRIPLCHILRWHRLQRLNERRA